MEITLSRVIELLRNSDDIVITTHINPDGDALGSLLALNLYLTSLGKKVSLLLDDEIPSLFKFLPNSSHIARPDNSISKHQLLIVLDASDAERIGKVYQNIKAPILNIDHHVSNTKYADYLYLDDKSAATGEILCDLFKCARIPFSLDISICLYTAIATDCGFFRYANTSAKTMRYAADLIESGVKPHLISEHLETKPLASIVALTKVLETLELHQDGKVALIIVMPEIIKNNEELTEGLINYPRNIEGVELAVMFKITAPDTIRASFRSRGVDVSRLALEFGGGGHMRAAGCTLHGSITSAKEKVLTAAAKLFTEG
jgi:phosphoesterase RecJ-like protein